MLSKEGKALIDKLSEGERGLTFEELGGVYAGEVLREWPEKEPLPSWFAKVKRATEKGDEKETRRLIGGLTRWIADALCQMHFKMGHEEIRERIRGGDVEAARKFVELFKAPSPLNADPDFQAVAKRAEANPVLMWELAKAYGRGPRWTVREWGLAFWVYAFKDKLESGEMPVKEFEKLLKDNRIVKKTYSQDKYGYGTGALRKFLDRMGIHTRRGRRGRPKKP